MNFWIKIKYRFRGFNFIESSSECGFNYILFRNRKSGEYFCEVIKEVDKREYKFSFYLPEYEIGTDIFRNKVIELVIKHDIINEKKISIWFNTGCYSNSLTTKDVGEMMETYEKEYKSHVRETRLLKSLGVIGKSNKIFYTEVYKVISKTN